MATERHELSVGDTLTPLAVQLKQRNASGVLTAVDLSGLTVKFTMVDSSGGMVVAETPTGVTVTAAATGLVQYDFQSGDVDTAGTFYGWFTVYNGSEKDTYPAGGRKLVIVISDRA